MGDVDHWDACSGVSVGTAGRATSCGAIAGRTASVAGRRSPAGHGTGAAVCAGACRSARARTVTSAISSFIALLETRVAERTAALHGVNSNLRMLNVNLQKEMALRRSVEDRLRHDALHDGLTILPNRHLLLDRLHRSVERRDGIPTTASHCCSWTWTISRTSTTALVTAPAMSCSSRSPRG